MKKDIWIWGWGDIGKLAYKAVLCEGKWNIKGIIDNNPNKQGNIVDGIVISSFDKIKEEIKDLELVVCCCRQNNFVIFKKELEKIGHKQYMHFHELNMYPLLFQFLEEGYDDRILSRCCTQEDFEKPWFKAIRMQLEEQVDWHCCYRKTWEFVFIIKALEEQGMLQAGKKGLGFAVGLEPLPSYFASKKVSVLATDLSIDNEGAKKWADANQNARGNKFALHRNYICSQDDFEQYVSYRDVNMNEIPDDIGEYDFCWSSCAIEHVGDLQHSKQFLKNMIQVLKPGGVAVHTTEFNLSSNDETITEGENVIFRKLDIEEMKEWFAEHRCHMETSYKRGAKKGDLFVDIPPYLQYDHHLNLQLGKFASTSIAIIVRKMKNNEQIN